MFVLGILLIQFKTMRDRTAETKRLTGRSPPTCWPPLL